MYTKKVSPQNTTDKDDSSEGKVEFLNKGRTVKLLADSSHHAYCFITQNPSAGGKILKKMVKMVWGVPYKGNPDFLHYAKNSLTIEDAHFLRDWGSVSSAGGSEKVCFVETHTLTSESQNALLKLFESAPKKTRFVLIIPSEDALLPTLYSRLMVSFLETEAESGISIDSFLSSTIAERGKMLKKIIEEKNKAEAQTFLDLLEKKLYKREHDGSLPDNSEDAEFDNFACSLPVIKKINADQRSSVKSILEHVIHFAPFINSEKKE